MKSRRAAERKGRIAESLAALYLMAKGYRILAQRARTHFGEIDLAALKDGALVIVEVKARASAEAGILAVGARARGRLTRAAQSFAKRWRLTGRPIRFDIMVMRPWAAPLHVTNAWREEDAPPLA
ncbi:MAG TPA: YraN family protein [Caulobacterales bacterium]|nr:YraN family protein [Caulobacterales bacterium]